MEKNEKKNNITIVVLICIIVILIITIVGVIMYKKSAYISSSKENRSNATVEYESSLGKNQQMAITFQEEIKEFKNQNGEVVIENSRSLPVINGDDGKVISKIKDYLVNISNKDWENLTNQSDAIKDTLKDKVGVKYLFSIGVDKDNHITFNYSMSGSLGGVGWTGNWGYNFNLITGEVIEFKDTCKDFDKIYNLVVSKIEDKYKDNLNSFNDDWKTVVKDKLGKLGNWYYTSTGIMLTFDKYELGPGSSGVIAVEISENEIKSDLNTMEEVTNDTFSLATKTGSAKVTGYVTTKKVDLSKDLEGAGSVEYVDFNILSSDSTNFLNFAGKSIRLGCIESGKLKSEVFADAFTKENKLGYRKLYLEEDITQKIINSKPEKTITLQIEKLKYTGAGMDPIVCYSDVTSFNVAEEKTDDTFSLTTKSGSAKVTGYITTEKVDLSSAYEGAGIIEYVNFNIVTSSSDNFLEFVGKTMSIRLGCLENGMLKSEVFADAFTNENQWGYKQMYLSTSDTQKIMNSTVNNQITLELEKLKYTGAGADALTCLSEITYINILESSVDDTFSLETKAGSAIVTGYITTEKVDLSSAYEGAGIVEYVNFNIVKSSSSNFSSFAGKSIRLGCLENGELKSEVLADAFMSENQYGYKKMSLRSDITKKIIDSTENNPITLELEKLVYTGAGVDVLPYFSQITYINIK